MANIFFIRDTTQKTANVAGRLSGRVFYGGRILPDQATKPVKTEGDTDPTPKEVDYGGKHLPGQKKTYQRPALDQSNNPSLTIINGVQLPLDTAIYLNGKKIHAVSTILDGVSVVERIRREPYEIEFEGVLRVKDSSGSGYVFPQDAAKEMQDNIFFPNSVLKVQNTFLNKLGIQELIIDSFNPVTVRGSKNVPFRMRAFENVPGKTLIVK